MTDYTDLIARLRDYDRCTAGPQEAADALEAQARRIAELEAALKAEKRIWIDALLENLPEEKAVLFREICLSAEKIRAARATLEKKND